MCDFHATHNLSRRCSFYFHHPPKWGVFGGKAKLILYLLSRLVRSQSNYLFTKERSEILRKEASVSDNNKKNFLSSNSINGLYQNLGSDEKKDREDDDVTNVARKVLLIPIPYH